MRIFYYSAGAFVKEKNLFQLLLCGLPIENDLDIKLSMGKADVGTKNPSRFRLELMDTVTTDPARTKLGHWLVLKMTFCLRQGKNHG
jgi:hypothetical protein